MLFMYFINLESCKSELLMYSLLTLVGLGGGDLPCLGFFRCNFFKGNFSLTKPIFRITIFMYYTLWPTFKKLVFNHISDFVNGGADLPPPHVSM